MVRAAAKNHARVTVVVDPPTTARCSPSCDQGRRRRSPETRLPARRQGVRAHRALRRGDRRLSGARRDAPASAASSRTCSRCSSASGSTCATARTRTSRRRSTSHPARRAPGVGSRTQLQGKELSFNNIADTDAALECVRQFDGARLRHRQAREPVRRRRRRHASPRPTTRAFRTDPTSAFGGIIAFNRPLDGGRPRSHRRAPVRRGDHRAAVRRRGARGSARRRRTCACWSPAASRRATRRIEIRSVTGGLLVQTRDDGMVASTGLQVVTKRAPTRSEIGGPAVRLAGVQVREVERHRLREGRHDRRRRRRPDEPRRTRARIAAMKARDDRPRRRPASVMASDAFFPFRDGLDAAAEPASPR